MKNLTKKAKISATILLLAITFMMVAPLPTEAQTQYNTGQYLTLPINIPTFLFVSAAPDPVGVGQTVYLSAIFSKPVPTSTALNGDMYLGITIKVTDPDGQVTTLGPHDGGMIGGWATTYVPTKIGEYKMQAFYPGQVLTLTNPYNSVPAGFHPELNGSKLMPSNSSQITFNVQEEAVTAPYQTTPLPTQYWTRPVMSLNWDWGSNVASNWLGLDATGFCVSGKYDATGCFQPYGKAPNTAHILWSRSLREGGQPGGPISSDPTTQFSSTSVTINMYEGAVVMNGIAYNTIESGMSGNVQGWEAIDLRTGATIWTKPAGIDGNEKIKCGFIFNMHNIQQYGSFAFLMTTGSTVANQGTVTRVYDAWTGTLVMNLTNSRNLPMIVDNVPTVADVGNYRAFDQQGGLLGWFVEGGNLKRWNSTYLLSTVNAQGIGSTSLGNTQKNWTSGIDQVIPLPTENNLNGTLGIGAISRDVIMLRFSPTFYYQGTNFGWQVTVGYDAITGAKLWGPKNQTLPLLEDTSVIAARDGVYVLRNKDTNKLSGYSLKTGDLIWGPVDTLFTGNTPLDIFSDAAYGKVYLWDMGGLVQAYDLNTGARLWNWSRGSAGYDDPRGVYELFGYRTHSIADGKLFLQEGVMYSPPLHPARRTVLNCTDGTLVWDILSYSGRSGSVVADGELLEFDSYDCKLYAFGQGPTAATVTAPNVEVPFGSSITVTGRVTDISAGTKQPGVVENFPDGVPAVSDTSVNHWMEYVYKQQIKPTNTTGVPVSLDVIDANNNLRHIGDTTTDMTGTFGYVWKPDIPGKYTLIATFPGSQAYYGSSAETFFNIGEAAQATQPTTVPITSVADTYLLPSVAAIIVAIAVVGAVLALLVIKKRP
jgi:hypothetical protein